MYKNYAKFAHRYRTKSPQRRNGPKKFGLYGKPNASKTQALQLKRRKQLNGAGC
jgi:hypothetical protein